MEINSQQQNPRYMAYLIFILSASFYLYEYVLQVAPSVMAEPMMRAFNVNAAGFGILSAYYFYAYAPMQLPAGLLFDRYGPRKLITFALCLCALGSFFFAATSSIYTAACGRFLIGIASAFSFIGVLVLLSRWFPPQQFAFLAGIAQLMSSVGAICGEVPLAALIQRVGWRNTSFILSFIGLILAFIIWNVVRDYPQQKVQKRVKRHFREELYRLIRVCRQSYTWTIGFYAFCIWTPITVFAALWGVPYLQEKFHCSVLVASSLCTMIWVGIGVGSPFLGWLSDRCNSRRLALGISAGFGLGATLMLLFLPYLSLAGAYFILFLFGVGSGGQSVSFALIKDHHPNSLVGTASGLNNLMVLSGGAIFQPLVGIILQRNAVIDHVQNLPVYTIQSYNKALFILPIFYLLSLVICLFLLKESHPNHQVNIAKLLDNNNQAADKKDEKYGDAEIVS